MQPTHARGERVSTASPHSRDLHESGHQQNDDHSQNYDQSSGTLFPEIPPVITRNFMISDTYYNSPASSDFGYPGPDEDVLDIGPGALRDVPEHVLAALPENCRQALVKARSEEKMWKESWGSENDDAARAKLRITYNM